MSENDGCPLCKWKGWFGATDASPVKIKNQVPVPGPISIRQVQTFYGVDDMMLTLASDSDQTSMFTQSFEISQEHFSPQARSRGSLMIGGDRGIGGDFWFWLDAAGFEQFFQCWGCSSPPSTWWSEKRDDLHLFVVPERIGLFTTSVRREEHSHMDTFCHCKRPNDRWWGLTCPIFQAVPLDGLALDHHKSCGNPYAKFPRKIGGSIPSTSGSRPKEMDSSGWIGRRATRRLHRTMFRGFVFCAENARLQKKEYRSTTTHTHTHIYICIYIYILFWLYICICVYIELYIYIYIHRVLCIYIYIYISIYAYVYVYICIYVPRCSDILCFF